MPNKSESPFRPRALAPGMTIGVASPSSPVEPAKLEAGAEAIRSLGYKVVVGEHATDRRGYLAGDDAARAADFTQMFARTDIDAVFCSRGGYGALRMVDLVDWSVVAANPKVFLGYSDITTLHLAFEHHTSQGTLYGPMVLALGGDLSQVCRETLWALATRSEPHGTLNTTNRPIVTLVSGTASGRLAGGCISLLAAAVGTKHPPRFAGRIGVLEDTGEPVYRCDRDLVQLLRGTDISEAAGFVIGTVTGWRDQEKAPPEITLDDLWTDLLRPLGKPTIVGYPFGHEPDPVTLPLGCLATLDADAGSVTLLEAAVS